MRASGNPGPIHYDGEHLIEDRGLTSPQAITLTYPIDQYVWLGNMPVAVIRQYFNSSMVRQTGATDCTRNGDFAPCGTFYIVNDYLPKPVALVNSAGKLAGIGEYDTFGRVNRVALRVDAPAQAGAGGWPFGTYFSSNNATLATFSPALRGGLQGRARFDYSLVNAASGHSTWIASGSTCATSVSPSYSGQAGNFSTPWFSLTPSAQYCLKWNAPGGSSTLFAGVVTKGYSYQNYEALASPTWIPLRFPGQYEDAETGLYENWNRFYDSGSGRYVASDPKAPEINHRGGYTYAQNRPFLLIDPDGLRAFNKQELQAIQQAIQRIYKVNGLRAEKLRMLLEGGKLQAFERAEFEQKNPGVISKDDNLDEKTALTYRSTIYIINFNDVNGLDATLVHELNHYSNPLSNLDADIPGMLDETPTGIGSTIFSLFNSGYEAEAEYVRIRQKVLRRCRQNAAEPGCGALLETIPALPNAK